MAAPMLHLFKRNRLLTVAMIVTLAIGVGVTAAMFHLVDVLLFRAPAHVADPQQLVNLHSATNYVQYDRLRDQVRSLDLAAYTRPTLTAGLGPDAVVIRGECVTRSYFQLLGTLPAVGHSFSTYGESSTAGQTVVLSYGLWQNKFAGDIGIVGRSMTLADRPHTIIGVAPRDFTGIELQPVDVWLALTQSPELCAFTGTNLLTSDKGAWLRTIGRIRSPFTFAQAEAEIGAIDARSVDSTGRGLSPAQLEPISGARRNRLSHESRVALWLAGGAVVVLLIACVNVGVFMALRAMDRRLEVAVRIQLGATAKRVFLLFFSENLVLSLLCIVGAVLVAIWIDSALRGFFFFLPDRALSARAFSILGGFALFAGLVSGLIPAMQLSRSNAAALLRGGQHIVYGRSRVRSVLLILQLALAQLLLVAGGLLVRSVQNLTNGAGYELDQVIVATVELERHGHAISDIWLKIDEFVRRARQIPTVSNVSTSSATLLGSGGSVVAVSIKPSLTPRDASMVMINAVSADYFATLGTRILRGRAFTAADGANTKPVIIVDQGLANETWPGEDPIGRCAFVGSRQDCIEVVGISEPRRSGRLTAVRKEFFVPSAQAAPYNLHTVPRTLFIRTGTSAREVIPSVVAVLQTVAPEVPASNVRPLLDLADQETRSWRLGAWAFQLFGALAAVMAGAGLYGALALAVRQRTAELAVRMVLGATVGVVLRIVARHVLVLLAAGWLAGTAAALLMARFLQNLLFEVAPTDLATHALVALLMCAMAFVGCLVPAIRAARLNPASALRQG